MSNTAGAVPSSLVALTRVLAAKLDDAGWDAVTLSIGKCTLSFNFTIITHKLRRQETFKVASSAAVAAVVVPSRLVAGWAGAIFEVTRSFGQEQWGQRIKQVTRGHNIGWAGASNPIHTSILTYPFPHTRKLSKTLVISLFNSIITDQRTNGPTDQRTNPLWEFRVPN